jgi:RNA polymerase sigma-70 factor, ECF subfamily
VPAIPLNFAFAGMTDTLAPVQRPTVSPLDQRDIAAALNGDEDAYRRIIDRHQREIAKRLRKFTRDPRVLEELVHDAFVEAWFSLKHFRGDAPLIHWLHRIAVRVGYRHWKSKKSERAMVSLQDRDIAAPQSSEPDTELLEQVLNKLSPRDRLIVTLMYLEERSVEETATLTAWSKTMVKVQAFRARGKLRKMMEMQLPTNGHEFSRIRKRNPNSDS